MYLFRDLPIRDKNYIRKKENIRILEFSKMRNFRQHVPVLTC